MAFSWTKEQQKVIDLRNRNILVSAAAGSGKTAVLVQRIIEKISDEKHPIDIDKLLIVTFTNAAAAQMRERISEALEHRLEEYPNNDHLKKQITLIHHANITTIHSFCLSVIRQNFHRINLDPSFRIGDEGELRLLKEDIMEQILEENYLKGDPAFLSFVDGYAAGKDDSQIAKIITQFYEFSRSYPWPDKWIYDCKKMYNIQEEQQLEASIWVQFLFDQVRLQLEEIKNMYHRIEEICKSENGPYPYFEVFEEEALGVERAIHFTTFEQLQQSLNSIEFKRKPTKKKVQDCDEKKVEVAGELRELCKKAIKKLQDTYGKKGLSYVIEDLNNTKEIIEVMIELVLQFKEAFEAEKRKKNLVDFSDLAHLALSILIEETENGYKETVVANQYSEQFEEIMIDEYQDSNLVQEVLLTAVSSIPFGKPNVFMVGDVKQSIYKFRLAKPELFMDKYDSYTTEDSLYQKIELHQNFRSRKSVLDGINYIFYQIMQKKLGNIAYTKEVALHAGMEYPKVEMVGIANIEDSKSDKLLEKNIGGSTEVLLLDMSDIETKEEVDEGFYTEEDGIVFEHKNKKKEIVFNETLLTSQEWEAKMIAAKIKELVDEENGQLVYDSKLEAYRRASYKDIVILLRTMSGWADSFTNILMGYGIPAYAESQSGYFNTIEVRTVLNLLKVIDNPIQDIPLAAVLKSKIVDITSEELGKVRGACPRNHRNGLYGAVLFYIEHRPEEEIAKKLEDFFIKLDDFRKKSTIYTLSEFIYYILNETKYYEFVMAMPAGNRRKANLDMLIEKALAFHSTSYKGLFHFVRYIEKLHKYEVDFGEASVIGENEDTVRIMSIHKSKGLEFPIVIVAGAGKQFNNQDSRQSVVFHPDFGVGIDYINSTLRTKSTTLIKKVFQQKILLENLGEELRILYVALTRAKEKLIITGAKKNLFDWLEKMMSKVDFFEPQLTYNQLTGSNTYLDFIIFALCKHRCFAPILEKLSIYPPFSNMWYDNEAQFNIKTYGKEDLLQLEQETMLERVVEKGQLLGWDSTHIYDGEQKKLIEDRLSFDYHYDDMEKLYATMSVSQIKKFYYTEEEMPYQFVKENEEEIKNEQVQREETETQTEEQQQMIDPFSEDSLTNIWIARGNAYHYFMEHLDYKRIHECENIETEVRKQIFYLVETGVLTKEEKDCIFVPNICAYLRSSVGQRMTMAHVKGTLCREKQFIIGINPKELFLGESIPNEDKKEKTTFPDVLRLDDSEIVMIQGIIDAYFEDEQGVVIVDYKTDRIENETQLIKRYAIQLQLYEKALERITEKKVKEKILYSFCLGKEIYVP